MHFVFNSRFVCGGDIFHSYSSINTMVRLLGLNAFMYKDKTVLVYKNIDMDKLLGQM